MNDTPQTNDLSQGDKKQENRIVTEDKDIKKIKIETMLREYEVWRSEVQMFDSNLTKIMIGYTSVILVILAWLSKGENFSTVDLSSATTGSLYTYVFLAIPILNFLMFTLVLRIWGSREERDRVCRKLGAAMTKLLNNDDNLFRLERGKATYGVRQAAEIFLVVYWFIIMMSLTVGVLLLLNYYNRFSTFLKPNESTSYVIQRLVWFAGIALCILAVVALLVVFIVFLRKQVKK